MAVRDRQGDVRQAGEGHVSPTDPVRLQVYVQVDDQVDDQVDYLVYEALT